MAPFFGNLKHVQTNVRIGTWKPVLDHLSSIM